MLPPSTRCKTKIGMQHPVAAALRIATTATPTPENKCRIECQNIICSPKPTPKGCRGREEVATVGGYAIPAGTVYCVCCVCQPKCMSMKISGVRYANMQQKCIFVLCKGKSIGAWLGFALPDLPNVMTMPAARWLSTNTYTLTHHTHWQTVTVQCVCPCRFWYSVSLFTYRKFFVGEYVFKWAKAGTNSKERSTFFHMKSMMIFEE